MIESGRIFLVYLVLLCAPNFDGGIKENNQKHTKSKQIEMFLQALNTHKAEPKSLRFK